LGGGIHGVERLARDHEQAVALGAAKADVAAHLRQADPADQLAFRRPYRHATIADVAAGIARDPEIAIDIAAHAVRPAVHPVNHEIAEPFLIAELVVGAARKRLRRRQYLRGGRTGLTGAALHVSNVRRDLLGALRCLLYVAGNLLGGCALLLHRSRDGGRHLGYSKRHR
jgi:hypothetical protein